MNPRKSRIFMKFRKKWQRDDLQHQPRGAPSRWTRCAPRFRTIISLSLIVHWLVADLSAAWRMRAPQSSGTLFHEITENCHYARWFWFFAKFQDFSSGTPFKNVEKIRKSSRSASVVVFFYDFIKKVTTLANFDLSAKFHDFFWKSKIFAISEFFVHFYFENRGIVDFEGGVKRSLANHTGFPSLRREKARTTWSTINAFLCQTAKNHWKNTKKRWQKAGNHCFL